MKLAVDWILKGHSQAMRNLVQWLPIVFESNRLVFIEGPDRETVTFKAQVLKELLCEIGRTAHTICVNSWCSEETIATNVMHLDQIGGLSCILEKVQEIAKANSRQILLEPIRQLKSHSVPMKYKHSIGNDDVIILAATKSLRIGPILPPGSTKINVSD
jgi:hypothetical protein